MTSSVSTGFGFIKHSIDPKTGHIVIEADKIDAGSLDDGGKLQPAGLGGSGIHPDAERRKKPKVDDQSYKTAADEDIEKKTGPYGRWGGSSKYSSKIASLLPSHKTYVEPFAGAASVFFSKEPADKEVLADLDEEVVHALKMIQSIDDSVVSKLERSDRRISKDLMFKLRDGSIPYDPVLRLHRFLYLQGASWSGVRSGISTTKDLAYSPQRLIKFKDRLNGVQISNTDYKKTIDANDSSSTLFFLDPPYSGEWTSAADDIPGGSKLDMDEFVKTVKSIKGHWIVVLGDRDDHVAALNRIGGHKLSLNVVQPVSVRGGSSKVGTYNFRSSFPIRRSIARKYHRLEKNIEGLPDLCSICKSAPVSSEVWWDDIQDRYPACDPCAEMFVPKALELVDSHHEIVDYEAAVQEEPARGWSTAVSDEESEKQFVPIVKLDDERRLVTGIVLEPDEIDAQNDTITAEVIEDSAHEFLRNFQRDGGTKLGFMHTKFGDVGFELAESFVVRDNMKIGGKPVKKGSWVITIKVTSDAIWNDIKAGKLTGFSIGGVAQIKEPDPKG